MEARKMKRMKRVSKKEPSLLRKLIEIHYEQAQRRKALRLLEKQSWSLDFLSAMLIKAGKSLGDGISLQITDKNGVKMQLTYDKAVENMNSNNVLSMNNDDIFNRLDDDAAVEDFIIRHNVR